MAEEHTGGAPDRDRGFPLSRIPLSPLSLALLLAVLVLAFFTPGFFTVRNLRNVGTQVPVNAILAAGMTVVILTGGIDLSVGSVHALCGVTAALILTQPALALSMGPWAVPLAVLTAVLLGALLGACNGAVVAWIRIPPFIVTLALLRIARGVAKHLTNGVPIGTQGPEVTGWEQINANWSQFRPLGLGYLAELVPFSFLVALVVGACLALLLGRTRFGRQVYAIGSNETAARLSGVPVARVKLLAYILMGLLAGLSGAIESAALQSGSPVTGEGYELNAIAAVVVGGTRLTGGQGSILGTYVGAILVIGVMNNALNLLLVPPFWQEVASGAIILVVALVDRLTRA